MANIFDLLLTKIKGQPQQTQSNVVDFNTGEQVAPQVYGNFEQNNPQIANVPDNGIYLKAEPANAVANSLGYKLSQIPDKINEGLFGKIVDNTGVTSSNPDNLQANASVPYRQGGLLNDFSTGFKDNLYNGFQVSNLMPDENKGFANRLGEGLGTALRFANSPLGRGLIVGGLVGATGGNFGQALAYGGQTAAQNQANVTKNRAYRQQLLNNQKQNIMSNTQLDSSDYDALQQELTNTNYYNVPVERQAEILENAKQKILNEKKMRLIQEAENNINSIGGYITDDIYKQLLTAQQLQDNATWKRMYYDNQAEQNKFNNDFKQFMLKWQMDKANQDRADKQAELDYKKQQDAINNSFKQEELDIKRNKEGKNAVDFNTAYAILDEIDNLYSKLPQNYAPQGTQKGVATFVGLANKLGLQSNSMAAFDAIDSGTISLMLRQLGEKGTLSDGDVKRGQKLTPKTSDSPGQAMAKSNALRDLFKKAEINSAKGINYKKIPNIDINAVDAELRKRGLL